MKHLGIVIGVASRSFFIILGSRPTLAASSNNHPSFVGTNIDVGIRTDTLGYATVTTNEVVTSGFSKAQSIIASAARAPPDLTPPSAVSSQIKRAHHNPDEVPNEPPYYTMVLWINGYDVTVPILKDNATNFCRSVSHDTPDNAPASVSAQAVVSSGKSSVEIGSSERTEATSNASTQMLNASTEMPTETPSHRRTSPSHKGPAQTGDVSVTLPEPPGKSEGRATTTNASSISKVSRGSAIETSSSSNPSAGSSKSHTQSAGTIDMSPTTESLLDVATTSRKSNVQSTSVSDPPLESEDDEAYSTGMYH